MNLHDYSKNEQIPSEVASVDEIINIKDNIKYVAWISAVYKSLLQ